MRIFLDPHREGCTVWFSDGNIQTLRGDIPNICNRIKNYVIDKLDDNKGNIVRKVQVVKVYLDHVGIGLVYKSCLNDLGVKIDMCTYNKVIM